jgi:hypothetical protein
MKSIDSKSNECSEKVSDIKADYQNKENESKQLKSRMNELKTSIEAMKLEYEESKDNLAELVVRKYV